MNLKCDSHLVFALRSPNSGHGTLSKKGERLGLIILWGSLPFNVFSEWWALVITLFFQRNCPHDLLCEGTATIGPVFVLG